MNGAHLVLDQHKLSLARLAKTKAFVEESQRIHEIAKIRAEAKYAEIMAHRNGGQAG